ncbi:NAD(P) transhydrogenase subunit alpha [Stackebrandtia soli]|uniref:NAD(P) transhydrogenase subunit alpha n=1 Tax=Stackebrandtia soli TaxID=1892856 RepID=UPI0039ED1280
MAIPIVGVIREPTPGERRVCVTPDAVGRIRSATSAEVVVQSGSGAGALIADDDYRKAEAQVVDTAAEVFDKADVIVCLDPPAPGLLRAGQVLVGMLSPLSAPESMADLAGRGVTAISLDMLPRTLSRAQSMDVLSSQANIAGYKAAVLAADNYGRYFPMLTTAAGTSTPATVLILGTGVAGLSAIGTARRLGAVVTAYDVRPQSRGEVESLGAKFLTLESVASAAGEGGYARALTDDERAAQQRELNEHIGRFDVVITTAKVPGKRPPLLVTADALDRMKPGSVVIDMAAGPLGGNVEGSVPEETIKRGDVLVVGAGNLPSEMAPAASQALGRNVSAVLTHLLGDGDLEFDLSDEINAGIVITHQGAVTHPAIAAALAPSSETSEKGEPA